MKKRISVILIVSMVINMTLPHAVVFANEVDKTGDTGQSKIAEQLKADLGEDRADEIMGVTKKSVEYTKVSYELNDGDNNGDAPDKNKGGNIVDLENDGGDNENGNGYADEPEDDGEPKGSKSSSEGEPSNDNSENKGSEEKENPEQTTESINESYDNESTSVSKSESTDESTSASTEESSNELTTESSSESTNESTSEEGETTNTSLDVTTSDGSARANDD